MTTAPRPIACDNCHWTGTEADLWDGTTSAPAQGQGRTLSLVPDLTERLDPGSEIPAGDCPLCQAFVYLSGGAPTELRPEEIARLGALREHALAYLGDYFTLRALEDQRKDTTDNWEEMATCAEALALDVAACFVFTPEEIAEAARSSGFLGAAEGVDLTDLDAHIDAATTYHCAALAPS